MDDSRRRPQHLDRHLQQRQRQRHHIRHLAAQFIDLGGLKPRPDRARDGHHRRARRAPSHGHPYHLRHQHQHQHPGHQDRLWRHRDRHREPDPVREGE